VILTNGQQGYLRWYPGHPFSEARRHMVLRVPIKPEDRTQGMFEIYPEYNDVIVPLCQFQLV